MTTQVDAPAQRRAAVGPERRHEAIGRMTALTLFTPIRRRWAPVLRGGQRLAKWVPIAQRHILQFEFIHFVRWAVVRKFPYNGPPQERERLHYPYLFFESNFDGPWQHYIDAFAYCIPGDIRFVWGRGIAFPGPPPAEPLKRWIGANSMEGGTYYCAYPHASTRMVVGALILRDGLRRLVAQAGAMGSDEFKVAYERFLTEHQRHL